MRGANSINDAVRHAQHFAQVFLLKLWYNLTDPRKSLQTPSGFEDPLHDANGIRGRMLRDVFADALEVV